MEIEWLMEKFKDLPLNKQKELMDVFEAIIQFSNELSVERTHKFSQYIISLIEYFKSLDKE
jgi:hypothetical protein